ncbi:DUF4232 domain-containing protein [Streptomyces sp. NPDC020742]|uniref:DUF4232 domain-containing protein n=1 Tax=unclassified Streptomyces TaxID=2593676 RepID=UPI0033FD9FAF
MPRRQTHTSTVRTAGTARRRTLRAAAAGLTAAAALTLTACGQDNPLQTSAAKPYHPGPWEARSAAVLPAAQDNRPVAHDDGAELSGTRPDGGDREQNAASGQSTGAGRRTADGTDGAGHGGGTAPVRHSACDADAVRIVAKPLERPVGHLLLRATNTSGAACDLYLAPHLQFDGAQSPLAELADSKPAALVTLAPGESGYAGVLTSSADGSGRHGRAVSSLSVSLPGRDGKGSIGGASAVPLPGGAVYVDDSAWVTYWQADPGDALAW